MMLATIVSNNVQVDTFYALNDVVITKEHLYDARLKASG